MAIMHVVLQKLATSQSGQAGENFLFEWSAQAKGLEGMEAANHARSLRS